VAADGELLVANRLLEQAKAGQGVPATTTSVIHSTPPTTHTTIVTIVQRDMGVGWWKWWLKGVNWRGAEGACIRGGKRRANRGLPCITGIEMRKHRVPELSNYSGQLQLQHRAAHGRSDLAGRRRSDHHLYSTQACQRCVASASKGVGG
jgi:hypothetical protein